MAQKNYDELDRLLHKALHAEPLPSWRTAELKEQMRCQAKKEPEKRIISLWYLPLVCSLLLSVFFLAAAAIFLKGSVLYAVIATLVCLGEGAQVLLTVVGLRQFDLRKGAEWERCYYL